MSAVKGVCLVRTCCGVEGSSDADVRTFVQKNFEFFEFYGMSSRTNGGSSQYGQEGLFIAILCGSLLWTNWQIYHGLLHGQLTDLPKRNINY